MHHYRFDTLNFLLI